MYKRIILFIIIVGIIGSIALYMYNKPPRNIAGEKEDFVLTANDLYKEYEANDSAANAKYLEKVVAVKGIILEIELENEEEPTVALKTTNPDITVRCGFKKEFLANIRKLKSGDRIKIKGKCDGMDMFGVVMTQCTIIK